MSEESDLILDSIGKLQYVLKYHHKLARNADNRATIQALSEMSEELAGQIDSQRRLAS